MSLNIIPPIGLVCAARYWRRRLANCLQNDFLTFNGYQLAMELVRDLIYLALDAECTNGAIRFLMVNLKRIFANRLTFSFLNNTQKSLWHGHLTFRQQLLSSLDALTR
jgi:hypothetical protein